MPKTADEWISEIAPGRGSWASRVADAIAGAVATGRLGEGDRLPTQRALARRLGVTTGTVNRGYAIAERAGLVVAEVGRGTFVARSTAPGIHDRALARDPAGAIDLALNYPAGKEAESALGVALSRLTRRGSGSDWLGLAPYAGRQAHRAAGARWLRRFGVSAGAEDVCLCTSVQHGLAATLAALTVSGDVVLTESLTSPGIKALAAVRQLRLVPVAGDDEGLLPDALASARRATGARVLYSMPTLHTPTTATMPEDRRRAIADVLRQENLMAIEDDAWGFLAEGTVTPLHTLAASSVVYVTSLSKSLAPGLRVGYVVAPASLQREIAASIGATTWTSPLLAEVAGHWIDDGTADAIAVSRVRTARERQRLAREVLGSVFEQPLLPAYHLWLPLPEPWRIDDFVAHAGARGVSLASTDLFVPGRAPTPHAVRLCLGTEPDADRVEEGLRIVAATLTSGPVGVGVRGA